MNRVLFCIYLCAALAVEVTIFGPGARAEDKLLDETVEFTGTILFLQSHVPALVIGVVRDGQTAVFGFGETSDGSGKGPHRRTMLLAR
jgi:D-alanyl-D-alanine-carboxypeptidase/D-alanyl-D-alanine-endopeptidase